MDPDTVWPVTRQMIEMINALGAHPPAEVSKIVKTYQPPPQVVTLLSITRVYGGINIYRGNAPPQDGLGDRECVFVPDEFIGELIGTLATYQLKAEVPNE